MLQLKIKTKSGRCDGLNVSMALGSGRSEDWDTKVKVT